MLAEQFDAFLIDLDGVVHVGPDLLPGAAAAVRRLRRLGRHVRFVTNDPRPTRAQVQDRLTGLGVEASLEEVVTSGWATARWLVERGITRAHVVGSGGLAQELAAQGVDPASENAVRTVVIGCDETLCYRDLEQASTLIRAGAQFVATNLDATFPTPTGPWPATGAVVAAVAAATGQRPMAIGKPAPAMFRLAQVGLPARARAVVVGDTPASDILGAHRSGLPAVLVDDNPSAAGPGAAEATIPGLAGLFDPAVVCHARPALAYPWPDGVRAGVAAVVLDDYGRVLLGRRADNGLWGLPSGHVEAGETTIEAAMREVWEETGLQVQVMRLVGVYSEPASQVFTYPDGQVIQFITTSFACTPTGGQLRADGVETTQVAFFAPDELPTDLLTMHPRWLTDTLSGKAGTIG